MNLLLVVSVAPSQKTIHGDIHLLAKTHLGIICESSGNYMVIIWGSLLVQLGAVCRSHGVHWSIICNSCGVHLEVMWTSSSAGVSSSCGHLGVMWRSSGVHCSIIWASLWDQLAIVWGSAGSHLEPFWVAVGPRSVRPGIRPHPPKSRKLSFSLEI